ncbi:MAG: ribonuclease P protein component [Helicobacter sp.]|nr:ribonuclease P protein component [Helicobacter sp.]
MITLKTKKDFNNVYHNARRWHSTDFILFFKESKEEQKRIGFCVSKKIGKATCRNLIKRRWREIYRSSLPTLKNGDMVLLAKKGVEKVAYQKLKQDFLYALSRLNGVQK